MGAMALVRPCGTEHRIKRDMMSRLRPYVGGPTSNRTLRLGRNVYFITSIRHLFRTQEGVIVERKSGAVELRSGGREARF